MVFVSDQLGLGPPASQHTILRRNNAETGATVALCTARPYTQYRGASQELREEQRKKEMGENGNKILIFSLCQTNENPLGFAG